MVELRVLIIGARGFIGLPLSQELLEQGNEVTCLTRGSITIENNKRFNWIRVDHTSQKSWDDIISKKFDIIYHLGWSTIPRTAEEDPVADVTENVLTGIRILNSIKNLSPNTRLIFTSSGGTIYGLRDKTPAKEADKVEPISIYGVGKLTLENYISLYKKSYGLKFCSARLANPYGLYPSSHADFGVIGAFVKSCINNEKIKVYGSLDIVRDYIHISDATSGLIALSKLDSLPSEINIGSGIGTSLHELVAIIEDITHKRIDVEIYEGRPFDVQKIILDISLIKKLCNWQPRVDILSGIADYFSGEKF